MRKHEQFVDTNNTKAQINAQVKKYKMTGSSGKAGSVVSKKAGSVVSKKRKRGSSDGEGGDGSSTSSSSSNSSDGGGGGATSAKKRKKSKVKTIKLIKVEETKGNIGIYAPEARKVRLSKFMAKRKKRIWTKRSILPVRKNAATSRFRFKGRFIKKEDEDLLRAAMEIC